jgi:hypothetical protein
MMEAPQPVPPQLERASAERIGLLLVAALVLLSPLLYDASSWLGS